ncbi:MULTISPECIES: solute carrier family 23 protein [unclassified Gemella]|uniref:solute carrier family 23 protein n=1 Tax=unclassified Gemella TaxID=2624949 RepID=UPI0010734E0F|nr:MULTISPECIES: solute carrier family 23 protein [unclassified Gemella]MBF0710606.1 uracil permease [Gemella sp. GL1.1]MBF0746415.1 uracil permease [Gemella sp. 19428wG2_WT2a]NYS27950.1 uracil permease [Gemella sp. GL1]TFU60198.1 uracil permease [Gemella sp. WT2a]
MDKKERVQPILDVHEKPGLALWITLSLQHLFAMFGATVLVPILTGLSASVALATSGIGTLTYLFVTQGKIPAYLGSSFAFISPIIVLSTTHNVETAMLGAFLASLVYGLMALLINRFGVDWLMRLLPPVVVGPIIIVIGLGLAPTAVDMAMNQTVNGEKVYSLTNLLIAGATLAFTILAIVAFRGFAKQIPILLGIVFGYLVSCFAGLVDFQKVIDAPWFAIPDFTIPFVTYSPEWNVAALAMVPIAIVTINEHIGHQIVLSEVTGKNFIKDPGLDKSILADGAAMMFASFLGGPPSTTYGENIGVLAITRIFSIFVLAGAAVFALILSFVGKFSAIISTIPTAVMGGVSILLFGIIASSGLRMLVDERVDLSLNRNLVISSVIIVLGVGGAMLKLESINLELPAMALSAIVGVILNAVIPKK